MDTEVIQSVEFKSLAETPFKANTPDLNSANPSTKFPQGIALLGKFYTPQTLDQIDADEFWVGLDSIGADHERRVARIRELMPVTHLCPDPRVNRRKLYDKITWLRTKSLRGWEFDKVAVRISTRNELRSEHLG